MACNPNYPLDEFEKKLVKSINWNDEMAKKADNDITHERYSGYVHGLWLALNSYKDLKIKDPEKLVRDKFDKILPDREYRIASKEELPHFFALKIKEEAQELAEELESGDIEKLLEEMADVSEILQNILLFYRIPDSQLIRITDRKFAERGGFDLGLILKRIPNWEKK